MRLGLPLILAASVTALGCGGKGANSPSRPLPSWAGHATELFDDAIEPRALGLELDRGAGSPASDPMLRERSQVGDAVLRVRVDTVTATDDGVNARYDIGLRTLEKLAGENPPPELFGVRVDKSSPASGLLRSFDTRLGGKTFIVFVREFVRPDGDTEWHFHFAKDDQLVASAVRDAVALGDAK